MLYGSCHWNLWMWEYLKIYKVLYKWKIRIFLLKTFNVNPPQIHMADAFNIPHIHQDLSYPSPLVYFGTVVISFSFSFLPICTLWWSSLSELLIEHLAYTPMLWCTCLKLVSCLPNQLTMAFSLVQVDMGLMENMWHIGFGLGILAFGEGIRMSFRVRSYLSSGSATDHP